MIKTLEALGTDTAFVYNGHGNWTLLDAIKHESGIQGIACKGEGLAVHMADGYYRSNIKGGVALVTASVGPGNMNITSALANAFFESSAMIVLAGAGATHWYDRGGIEEFYRYAPDEYIQTLKTYTKKALVVSRPDTAVEMLLRAYKTAITGRPGPVVLQVPFDIQNSLIEFDMPANVRQWVDINPPGPDVAAIRNAAELIARSKRPLVAVSSGIHRADAFEELAAFLEEFGLPLCTTTMGKGAYPEDKPLCLGAIGRSGTGHANRATKESDLVIAIGIHFSDVDTGGWTIFDIPSKTKLIHIDIDPTEIARIYPTEVGIFSDARLAITQLGDELRSLDLKADLWSSWRTQLGKWREEWEQEVASIRYSDQTPLNYARLCNDVSNVVNELYSDASVFVDTGHLLSFAPPFFTVRKPNFFHNGFFHCMGWSLAAALGSKLAMPGRPALAVMGDGSFLFSNQTLATAYEYDLPVTAVVLNNRSLQIEREAMMKFYGRTAFVDSVKQSTNELWSPDLMKVAEAMGANALKVKTPGELAPALKKALGAESSWVIDVDIDINAPGYRSVWYPYPNDFWVSKNELPKHL
jgi:acetolactate synthase-1/2/3 large subunit